MEVSLERKVKEKRNEKVCIVNIKNSFQPCPSLSVVFERMYLVNEFSPQLFRSQMH